MISRPVLDDIVAHARESWPRECCGILIGSHGRIVAAARAKNLAEQPTRYLIDPQDHIIARKSARAQDLAVVGFYHSHPHSAAEPSPTDLGEWTYDDAVQLIVSLRDTAQPQARLFAKSGEAVRELPLEQLGEA